MVELVKTIQYHVEAEDSYEAENMAIELDSCKEAEIKWATDPYDEIRVEED
jgi:hypothetical protein